MTQSPSDGALPAYPTYPGADPGTAMEPPAHSQHGTYFRSLRTKARVVQVIAAILALMTIFQAALGWGLRGILADLDAGGDPDLGIANAFDAVGLLVLAGLLAAFVATGVWLYDAHRQAPQLWPHLRYRQARKSGWAWGGWIVPIVCLWFPFQVVRDSVQHDPQRDRSSVVGWWWALWLSALLIDRVNGAVLASGDYETAMMVGPLTSVFSALFVAAAVLWIFVVQIVTERQELVGTQQAQARRG